MKKYLFAILIMFSLFAHNLSFSNNQKNELFFCKFNPETDTYTFSKEGAAAGTAISIVLGAVIGKTIGDSAKVCGIVFGCFSLWQLGKRTPEGKMWYAKKMSEECMDKISNKQNEALNLLEDVRFAKYPDLILNEDGFLIKGEHNSKDLNDFINQYNETKKATKTINNAYNIAMKKSM